MAKGVETALSEIVAEHDGRQPSDAAKSIAELKAQGR
jgi:sulfite reductase alpha subunit-like flavoprotein